MPLDKPSPQQLTLRFKCHKTTILLFVSPHDSFASIKSKLLDALKVANITQIQGQPLPTKSDDVLLGVLINLNDPGVGWTSLEIPEKDDKKGSKSSGVLNASPMGAGIKDGSMLAFKFRGDDSDADDLDMGDSEWDVVMPTFDDEEGSQVKEVDAV
ncbi:MAG: hypothetical protein Q9169_000470 [Polycauliona sp. 2 TL-2023]